MLSGGIFLEVLTFCCISLFCPLFFIPRGLVLFSTVDVITLSWVLTFFVTVLFTVQITFRIEKVEVLLK
jgi:hypothetical protein